MPTTTQTSVVTEQARMLALLKKAEKVDDEEILQQIYQLADDYNDFVKSMDSKIDKLLAQLE